MPTTLKQCPDGYMTCRQAEAGGGWCQDKCASDQPRTDASLLREVSATLEKLLLAKPMLSGFAGSHNTLGNLRVEINQHIKVHPERTA